MNYTVKLKAITEQLEAGFLRSCLAGARGVASSQSRLPARFIKEPRNDAERIHNALLERELAEQKRRYYAAQFEMEC